jgi:hypothetical protein
MPGRIVQLGEDLGCIVIEANDDPAADRDPVPDHARDRF